MDIVCFFILKGIPEASSELRSDHGMSGQTLSAVRKNPKYLRLLYFLEMRKTLKSKDLCQLKFLKV